MFGKGLFTGLKITLKRMLGPNITEFYPDVMPALPPRTRSSIELIPEKCIACNLCAVACPNQVIKLTGEKNEENKRVVTSYTMDISRCLYCGLCVEACNSDALLLTQEFEQAVYYPEHLHWDMMKRAEQSEQTSGKEE